MYIYQADILCDECGDKVRDSLIAESKQPEQPDDENTFDSNDFPKYALEANGDEADYPMHCGHCDVFMENALTNDGVNYVVESIADHIGAGRGKHSVIAEWAEFYDISLDDVMEFSHNVMHAKSPPFDPLSNPL